MRLDSRSRWPIFLPIWQDDHLHQNLKDQNKYRVFVSPRAAVAREPITTKKNRKTLPSIVFYIKPTGAPKPFFFKGRILLFEWFAMFCRKTVHDKGADRKTTRDLGNWTVLKERCVTDGNSATRENSETNGIRLTFWVLLSNMRKDSFLSRIPPRFVCGCLHLSNCMINKGLSSKFWDGEVLAHLARFELHL